MHSCVETLGQTLLQYWEQDGHISVVQYLGTCIFLSWFSEVAQPEPLPIQWSTCFQALMNWHSQLALVDNVSRTCVSKIPQLFSLTEYGKGFMVIGHLNHTGFEGTTELWAWAPLRDLGSDPEKHLNTRLLLWAVQLKPVNVMGLIRCLKLGLVSTGALWELAFNQGNSN